MNRKVLTGLALLMLLLAAAQSMNLSLANFFPAPGPDLSRIYIRSNGDVEPATAPIQRTGNLYKLTDNITMHTIVIQRDNIVVDGSGFSIEGNKSWMGLAPRLQDSGNNGIIIAGRNHINLTNFNIEKFTAGVRISDSSNINIIGNRFNEEAAVFDTPMGIVIEDSSNVLIESNNFTKINGPAIACNGTNITIRGNTLTDVFDGTEGSISLKGSSNTITDNTVEGVYASIKLGSAYSNVIARNNITGDVSLLSCSQNLLQENNLKGIYITFGSNNTVYGNRLANNSTIVELTQTKNNTFYGNTFELNCSIRVYEVGTNFWDKAPSVTIGATTTAQTLTETA